MKRLFAIAVLVLAPVVMMGQNTHFKFTQDGAFASANLFTPPFTVVGIRVASGTGTSTSLQYSLVSIDAGFTTLTITNVFGSIPSSAFTGQNTQNLAVNIDTSTLDPSTFFSETCTTSLTTGTTNCGAGPAGLIQLSFRENDAVSRQVNLHEVDTNGPVTTRISQRSDQSTANVTGTVFGTDFSGASAEVGINHMSTIEVTRN